MDPLKFDRLSSLLLGLAPRVRLSPALSDADFSASGSDTAGVVAVPALTGLGLHLHVAGASPVALHSAQGVQVLSGTAYWIGRGDQAHSLQAPTRQALAGVLSATVHLEGPLAPLLLAEFDRPKWVAIDQPDLLLNPIIALARSECVGQRCAMPTVLDHAGHILFVGVLRHLVAQPSVGSGLLCGLSDPRIASALVAMHGAPEKAWTLETLAEQAGMSRTAFALRFKSTLQRTPGKYLSSLRMHIAHRRVQAGEGLKAAARASGYKNVSALSRALGKTAAPGIMLDFL